MMKQINRIGGIIVVLLFLLLGSQFLPDKESIIPFGSVAQTGEYHYTQLTGAVATTSLIQTGVTTLGSVIITEDQAGAVVLFDATSTAALDNDSSLYSRIADFQSAEPEGVYTFDVVLKNGLVFQSADGSAFDGDWTITYR